MSMPLPIENWRRVAGATSAHELCRKHTAFVKELEDSQKDRKCIGEVDGVMTETQPFYTCRGHERARVMLGPEKENVCDEWTTIPWNFFRPSTVSYWYWLCAPSENAARDFCKLAGIAESFHVEADPYAEPAIYHVWVSTLEDVVKLYKHHKSLKGWFDRQEAIELEKKNENKRQLK